MDHSSHNDDAHLTRSFFMQKTSVSGELIFKKKLKRPLQLAGPKCVSHFRIRGLLVKQCLSCDSRGAIDNRVGDVSFD